MNDSNSSEIQSQDKIELLLSNLKIPSKKIVFYSIDTIIKNNIIEAVEPLKQLLINAEKDKLKAYAGLALKELKYHLSEDEDKILYSSITNLLSNQDIETELFGAELLLKCYPKSCSSELSRLISFANNYIAQKSQFKFSDEQLKKLFILISTLGTQDTFQNLKTIYAKDYYFKYDIDRYTQQPNSYPEKLEQTEKYRRTVMLFQCFEELSNRLEAERESIGKYVIKLIAEEKTFIGDDSRDQDQIIDVHYSKF